MVLYRYAAREHNDTLLTMGVLRVGTLHDFRKTEHKQGVADPQEGRKSIHHFVKEAQIADSNEMATSTIKDVRAVHLFGVIEFEDCTNVSIEKCHMTKGFNAPDCYIVCFSRYLSDRTMSEIEGYNSCVEITDNGAFLRAVTDALNTVDRVKFVGLYPVAYQLRAEEWNGKNWSTHPALIKEPEYAAQGESRAIWMPTYRQAIVPTKIMSTKLAGLCEVRALPIARPLRKRVATYATRIVST